MYSLFEKLLSYVFLIIFYFLNFKLHNQMKAYSIFRYYNFSNLIHNKLFDFKIELHKLTLKKKSFIFY